MKSKQQDFRTEKYIRYGIRKYSLGVASVAISAGLMFWAMEQYRRWNFKEQILRLFQHRH